MTDKASWGDTTASIPLKSYEEATSKDDDLPPPYEHPKIDFSSGWKDRWFGIAFWLHAIAVIIVGFVLGIPYLISLRTSVSAETKFNTEEKSLFDKYLGILAYALGSAAAAGGVTSLVTFFLLQLCAGRVILCTLIIVIIIETGLGIVLLLVVHWAASILPFALLLLTLIFIGCVWKRIPFAEVHLHVGCAALRSNFSVIFVALGVFIVEALWFVAWFLMVMGIYHAIDDGPATNATEDAAATTTSYIYGATPVYTTTTTLLEGNRYQTRGPSYATNRRQNFYNTTDASLSRPQSNESNILRNIIAFLLLLSWYWGAVLFANIVHFISACNFAHWWFGDNDEQQYSLGTSIRRAFTTNFGTIAFGSFFDALLKAMRSSTDNKSRTSIFACVASCILLILEKIIGYINEWAFIYAALTGQSFIQASRSFIELFKKRGWTMVINDVLVGQVLGIINLMVGLTSATVGGVLVYIFVNGSMQHENTIAIIIAVSIGFLLGFLFSSVMTTIISSYVRTALVCFALNPAALGATHPEHLQRLTKAWNKFYPAEFATSGYPDHLSKYHQVENV